MSLTLLWLLYGRKDITLYHITACISSISFFSPGITDLATSDAKNKSHHLLRVPTSSMQYARLVKIYNNLPVILHTLSHGVNWQQQSYIVHKYSKCLGGVEKMSSHSSMASH